MKQKYRHHYNPDMKLAVDKPTEISVEEVGECTLCHFASSPTFINGYLVGSKENSNLNVSIVGIGGRIINRKMK